MKATVNIVCIFGIIAVLAIEFMPDINIPINGGESAIASTFSESLSADLLEIANASDVDAAGYDKAIENAFQRAADEADRELDKSIEPLAADDYEGLGDVLRKTAEGLR